MIGFALKSVQNTTFTIQCYHLPKVQGLLTEVNVYQGYLPPVGANIQLCLLALVRGRVVQWAGPWAETWLLCWLRH